jgi:hypothetical protein
MEEAFQAEGRKLDHLVGPGVEHKYEAKTLKELLKRIDEFVQKGKEWPSEVHLQTRTLRYSSRHWVTALGLEQHWADSRIDAKMLSNDRFEVETKNISALALKHPYARSAIVKIDGQAIDIKESRTGPWPTLVKKNGKWHHDGKSAPDPLGRAKLPGCQGPIDDAFMSPFVVITPSGRSKNAAFQAWVDFELTHFRSRWKALMRGDLPELRDTEFASEIHRNRNLILFGDADSNFVIKHFASELPVKFSGANWTLGNQSFDGSRFVPALIHPAPKSLSDSPASYLVLNSGLTFREAHDRTNSQQNPKLPDWAIIDMTQPPDGNAPGRIHDAGFFDEQWKLKGEPKAP